MNKPTIILLLILTLFSCQKNIERIDVANELRGNTFNMTSIGEKDTLTIEFKDSTYTVFEYSGRNLPWRISTFDNNDFLVLDSRIIAIKPNYKNNFDGLLISEKDYKIQLERKKSEWNKESIYGTWIEEKYVGTDSTDFPPPPIQPDNDKWNWPPNYSISKDKITLDFYDKFESKIEINNSGEFILMNLKNSYGLGITEELWQIKHLSDSIMIVDKKFNDILLSHGEKSLTNIKLIKKR